jgi:HSP20 family protein
MNTVQDNMNNVARQVNADHHPGSAFSPSRRAARPMKEGDQMATMTRWDPFQDLRDAQDEMAQMAQMAQMSPRLAHALGLHGQPQGSGTATAWAPALDISERKDAYLVTVELPGIELDDLEITMEDGLLTIQGERQFAHESSEQQFHRVERRYGAFRRSITLPAQVQAEQIEASFENGVLQIVVPKMEEAKPKRIQVRPGPTEVLAASSAAGTEATTPS